MVNEPLSVGVGKVQGVLFKVRLKLVVPREPSAFTVNVVWKVKVLAVAVERVAFQMPLILPVACELAPQLVKIRVIAINSTAVSFFMGEGSCAGTYFWRTRKRQQRRCRHPLERMPVCGRVLVLKARTRGAEKGCPGRCKLKSYRELDR